VDEDVTGGAGMPREASQSMQVYTTLLRLPAMPSRNHQKMHVQRCCQRTFDPYCSSNTWHKNGIATSTQSPLYVGITGVPIVLFRATNSLNSKYVHPCYTFVSYGFHGPYIAASQITTCDSTTFSSRLSSLGIQT